MTYLKHTNMKTVAFWPVRRYDYEDNTVMYGYWYCYMIKDLLDTGGADKITIKKEDLPKWKEVEI